MRGQVLEQVLAERGDCWATFGGDARRASGGRRSEVVEVMKGGVLGFRSIIN